MDKTSIGNKPYLYPYPVVLIGAEVDGKPNFMTIAFCGIVNMNPGMIAFGASRNHYTNKGIIKNQTFSVNIPTQEMLEIVDYVGIYSGNATDKSGLFNVFYGQLKNAPLINDCPINMECKVLKIINLGGVDDIFIGEIIETYANPDYLKDGLPDIEKIKPLLFSMFDNRYFSIGNAIGQGWSDGKNYIKSNS